MKYLPTSCCSVTLHSLNSQTAASSCQKSTPMMSQHSKQNRSQQSCIFQYDLYYQYINNDVDQCDRKLGFYYPFITYIVLVLYQQEKTMFGMMGLGLLEAEIIGAEVGMMMGAGMMGAGMMMGRGMCPPGCMNSCCRRVIVCRPGCMNSCCVQRVMCAPGCTLPCCMNPQVMSRTYQYARPPPGVMNTDPYAPNQFFMSPQPQQMQPVQQMQTMQQTQQQAKYDMNSQNDMQRQQLLQRKAMMDDQKRRQQQMAQKIRLEKEQLLIKQQEQVLKQQRLEQELERKRIADQKSMLVMNQQKMQQQQQQQQVQMNSSQRSLETALFTGNVYQKFGFQWKNINGATLTLQNFVNVPIQQMTKIKIKGNSEINLTRLIKICTFSAECFFSVFENQHVELGTKLIWAKLATMGKQCRLDEPFNRHVQGQIVKKGFFSGWEVKYANISGDALRISNQLGSPPQIVVNRIPELWTRFQIVRGNLLVLKMHNLGTKVQIGVPLQNCVAWIRAIYNLIPTM